MNTILILLLALIATLLIAMVLMAINCHRWRKVSESWQKAAADCKNLRWAMDNTTCTHMRFDSDADRHQSLIRLHW